MISGVPSTLNYVDLNENKNNKSPDLRPYPDFASNLLTNTGPNKPLVSVYRTRVDECDRLWAVDNGILDVTGILNTNYCSFKNNYKHIIQFVGNRRTIQPPAIVVFDLNTDKLIHRYELKADDDYLYNDASGNYNIMSNNRGHSGK